jgi:hypothetical protein
MVDISTGSCTLSFVDSTKQGKIFMSQIFMRGSKFATVINGKTVTRSKREHLEYAIRKSTETVGAAPVAVKESKFTINERFGFVADMVTMLARGDQASVVVTGPGGLGKSHNVSATLSRCGFQDISTVEALDVGARINGSKSFRVIKGYSTPKGLYRILFENKDGVIVFDDCDSVLKDSVSLNLLKGALDSYSRRIITWRSDSKDDELPSAFEFKGRVVFISNLPSHSVDQAILTRSMTVDLSMTAQQKVERMRYLLSQADFMPEFEKSMKVDALNLIDSLRDEVKELSLRTLIQVTKIRKSNPNGKWKELAEYAVAG